MSLTSVAFGAVVSLLPEAPLPGPPGLPEPPEPPAAIVTACVATADGSPLSSTARMWTLTVPGLA